MCALVTGVQTCALPISSKRPGYDLASVARKARSYILSRSKRALLVRLEQRADLVDVRLHRRIRLAALELGPGVMLGAADHVEHAGPRAADITFAGLLRSAEHTSELQSLMRISYAGFCLQNKNDS